MALTKALGGVEVRKGWKQNNDEARGGKNQTHDGKYSPTGPFFRKYEPAESTMVSYGVDSGDNQNIGGNRGKKGVLT